MARNKYDIDEKLESEFNINHLKRLAGYVLPYKKQMFITVIIMFVSSFMSMLGPMFLQKVMDDMIPEKNISGIFIMGGLYIATLFVIAFCLNKKILIMAKIGQDIIHQIRTDIFEHLQKLPFSYYDDRPHGKILVRVVNYINSLSDKEKAIILTEIIKKIENLALIFSQEINISLPINDDISISILNCLGYNTIDSDNKKTIIFNKKEEKRSLNGQTLSRKQRKRFNKSRCNKQVK